MISATATNYYYQHCYNNFFYHYLNYYFNCFCCCYYYYCCCCWLCLLLLIVIIIITLKYMKPIKEICKNKKRWRHSSTFVSVQSDQSSDLCWCLCHPHILSTAIAYLCVIDAKHFLNDPHSDKNAIMSYTDYTRYEHKLAIIYRMLIRSFQSSKRSVNFRLPKSLFPTLSW